MTASQSAVASNLTGKALAAFGPWSIKELAEYFIVRDASGQFYMIVTK